MATNLVIPSDIQSRTADQKADFYSQQRMAGFSDPAIRNAVSGVVGPQSDSDWNYLLQLSGYNNVAPDALYRNNTSGNSLIAALRGGTPSNPAGSTSSFSMLPNRESAPMPAPAPRPEQPFLLNRVAPFEAMPTAMPGSARPVGTSLTSKAPATAPVTAPVAQVKPAAAPAPAPAPTPAPPPKNARFPSWVYTDLSPIEKAAVYNSYAQRGSTSDEIRALAGTQTDEEWAALEELAGTLPMDIVKPFPTKSDVQTAVKNWQEGQKSAPVPGVPTGGGVPSIPASRETDDAAFMSLLDMAQTPDMQNQLQPVAQPQEQQAIDDQLMQEMLLADLGYIPETTGIGFFEPDRRRGFF